MAVNHYSADSAPRSCPSLHPRSSNNGNEIPVEITGFPISIRKLTAPASFVYVLADDASIYIGHSGCHRRLTEHTALPTTTSLTGTFPSKTSLD
jgi:hypothetical protein